jgi:hypothetical protein
LKQKKEKEKKRFSHTIPTTKASATADRSKEATIQKNNKIQK